MVRLNLLANRAATIMEASKHPVKRSLPAWVLGVWVVFMGALTYPIWR